jgi:hypothetical protein
MLAYLAYYRPFKNSLVLISNFASELLFSLIYISFLIFTLNQEILSRVTYQNIVIFSVVSCVGVQFGIILIEFLKSLKNFLIKLEDYRNKSLKVRSQVVVAHVENIIEKI